MNQKEAKTVEQVVRKLCEAEKKEFTIIDDYMEILSDIDDDQLSRECAILLVEHKTGHIVPDFDVPNPALLAPMILEAVAAILLAYEANSALLEKHRYVLEMYLALAQSAKYAAMRKKR